MAASMRFVYLIFKASICLLLQFNSLFALTEKYQLIDLGLLAHEESEATSINHQGQICGHFLKGKTNYLFIWEKGKKYNYSYQRISTNPVINNDGHIYGSSLSRVKRGLWELDQESIFKWENPFSYFTYFNVSNIGFPPSLYSTAYVEHRTAFWDVNDLGQVLTMNQNVINTKLNYEIWLYDNHEFVRIDNPDFNAAIKINNQSQLLCYFFDGPFGSRTMKTAVHHLNDGTTHYLPFAESKGYDLNDLGEVVGIFFTLDTHRIHGFFGNPSGEILKIDNFVPKALNNHRQIIGKYLDGEKKGKPAIWDDGVLRDLSDLTELVDDQGNQWHSLDILIDINDRGEIIGEGLYMGKTHAFLLIPL
jgi:hypothetical protein